jgi:hypothetical protein
VRPPMISSTWPILPFEKNRLKRFFKRCFLRELHQPALDNVTGSFKITEQFGSVGQALGSRSSSRNDPPALDEQTARGTLTVGRNSLQAFGHQLLAVLV